MSASYRPEIDGLRALAVLPVLFFHAKFAGFDSGFVGVDIFFVISGFLITKIILADLEAKRFSVLEFYARRARRILPALVVVCLVVAVASWAISTPVAFAETGRVLVWVGLFASNIYFWRNSGYWSPDADTDPLRHTWSLSVEEQFYILFPLMLLVLWGLGRRLIFVAISLVALASFALALVLVDTQDSFVFYTLPTRAFELAAGALAVFWRFRVGRVLAEIVSVAALLGLLVSVSVLSDGSAWPGVPTLLPVISTVLLLILTPETRLVRGVLSVSVLRGIGLISYSLYLWHQPVLAFWRQARFEDPNVPVAIGLLVVSAGLAWLSWKLIETPFRRTGGALFLPRGRAVTAGAVSLVALIGLGAVITKSPVSYLAITAPAATEAAKVAREFKRLRTRHCTELVEGLQRARCREIGEDGPRVLIWGDSHSFMLTRGFVSANPGYHFTIINHDYCPPIQNGLLLGKTSNFTFCHVPDRPQKLAEILLENDFDKIVLASRWTMYFNGTHDLENLRELNPDGTASDKAPADVLRDGLATTLGLFGDAEVYALQQIPDLFRQSERDRYFGTPVSRAEIDAWHADADAMFEDFAARGELRYIPTHDLFCTAENCSAIADGANLYRDDNHSNDIGSARVIERIINAFDR